MKTFVITIAVFLSAPAAAELYICKENGKSVYVSIPKGDNCRLQQSLQRTKPAARQVSPRLQAAPANKQAKSKKAAPKKYPVVSAATQKLRDKKRREILLYELESEQQSQKTASQQLEEIKKIAPENEKLLSHLESQLHIHTQNITAIKQELARL